MDKLLVSLMHKFLRFPAAAAAALLAAQFAFAQPNENWTEVNLATVDYHVIPRYAAFAEAGSALSDAAEGFCPAPDAARLEALRQAFHGAMDAWQGIQHVQFGPITYFNWNYRLQFWPDDNNTGARQLSALIAAADASVLEMESFARQSVGVQGFPALERLLFEEDAASLLAADAFRCQVARTISRNIARIARDVHARWTEEFRTTVANADERGFFESAQDATIDLLKAQVEPMPRLRDQKLGAVLGESFARARARLAESWRSERSLRNLKINLASLEEMFSGGPAGEAVPLSSVFHEEDAQAVRAGFARSRAIFAELPDSLAAALGDEASYAKVVEAKASLDAVYEAMEQALKNTDLYLGFNSLDGD